MRCQAVATLFLGLLLAASALDDTQPDRRLARVAPAEEVEAFQDLWKRRGGGGRGGGSGGGGGGSGRGGGSGGGGSGGRVGNASPSSNNGGRTTVGTGPPRTFGRGGGFYGGGAAVPYTAGRRTPRGISPSLVGLAALVVFGSLLASYTFSAWLYRWPETYTFFNETLGRQQTLRVICSCEEYLVCGCEYQTEDDYLDSIVGTGAYDELNLSMVAIAEFEGQRTLLIDGTLPNGTTAPGGDVAPDAGTGVVSLLRSLGFWPVAAAVGAMVLVA